MRILVTGDRGFIGTHLCKTLVAKGHDIIGYDLVDGFDIRDTQQVSNIFSANLPDAVIHLAALAGVREGEEHPTEYYDTNVGGTLNVLRASRRANVNHFILFSSSSVYGDQNPPNVETQEFQPRGVYGKTKMYTEIMAGVDSVMKRTIVRPFTVYGEGGRPEQVIFKWINQIKAGKPITFFGDGTTERGYVYVGDLVEGVVAILDTPQYLTLETFNLGGNEVITLNHLLKIFQSVVPDLQVERLPLSGEEVHSNWANINKAKEKLLWIPKQDFSDKVKAIIKAELLK